jgi:hypothetical protein
VSALPLYITLIRKQTGDKANPPGIPGYAPDVTVEGGSGARLMEDREAMRAFYGRLFDHSPDLHAEVLTRIRVREFVIDEERVTGMCLEGWPDRHNAPKPMTAWGARQASPAWGTVAYTPPTSVKKQARHVPG